VAKQRVDALLVARGLAESRSQAQRLLMAGQVRANGQLVDKPAQMMAEEIVLEVLASPRFVSRGGEKLEAAISQFNVDVSGLVCVDVGSSTGGFTDCLLQHGAARVYAIDVGKGQLHWKLRNDARVIVMEETNARNIQGLPEQIDLLTADASFISLRTLLPVISNWLKMEGQLIALIKPQFEAGKHEAARGKGVIRDRGVHLRVLTEVLTAFPPAGLEVRGLLRSPILGPKGNVEFLAWAQRSQQPKHPEIALIERVLEEQDGS
jgi:23S rRNA (cytidine1920-2'-O)/16S rRNA (cytidine1409-2'-O)-methyltransferase